MAHQSSASQTQSGFWFGITMGSILGSAGLYFFGTQHGRKRLRDIIDACENFEGSMLEELGNMLTEHEEVEGEKKTVPAIHAVLDKIQSSIPSQKEIEKFFVKDGKILK